MILPYQATIKELNDYCIANSRWCEFSKGRLHRWTCGDWI